MEIVYDEEKQIFCTGQTRAAKAGQKSLVPVQRALRTNQGMSPNDPFHVHSLSSPLPPLSIVSPGQTLYTGNSLDVRRLRLQFSWDGNILSTPILVVLLLWRMLPTVY